MTQIYSNSDFQLYLPYYLGGIDFGENSTLKVTLFTINRDNCFSYTISANPCPVYINVEAKNLSLMESGVLRCLLTLSQPNEDYSDGYNDKTSIITTDFFYNRPNNSGQFDNYYTKSETQQIIDELEATIAAEYPDSVEVETIISDNLSDYYNKSEADDLLLTKANLHGDGDIDFIAKSLLINPWKIYADENDSQTLKFKNAGSNRIISLPQHTNGTLALTSDFYSNTQIDNLLTNKADKSQFVTLTQSEYDNLETVDPNKYYFIVEE